MGVARQLLERLARGKSYQRRLPEEFGRRPLIVSPDAALKYLGSSERAFARELLDVASEWVNPGDVVWDVGANVGVFAVAAAHRAGSTGRVLAIEADAWLASIVRRTASLPDNHDIQIEVLPAAVSSTAGAARFAIASRGRASNSLVGVQERDTSGGVRETQLVPTIPMDLLLEEYGPPKVIKIDVEGAELLALQGAERVLREARPVLYLEVAGEKAEDVASLLREARYQLLDPEKPAGEREPLDRCLFNTLAVPEPA